MVSTWEYQVGPRVGVDRKAPLSIRSKTLIVNTNVDVPEGLSMDDANALVGADTLLVV